LAKKKNTTAEALLEAHVQFMLRQFEGKALRPRIEKEIDALLGDAERIHLKDVVSREAVKETVRVYAVKLELNAGIPELVADIAHRLHAHQIHAKTRLSDLLSDQQFGEILDKAAGDEGAAHPPCSTNRSATRSTRRWRRTSSTTASRAT